MYTNASKYPLFAKGLITNPYEGIVYGNGDLAANVQIFSHKLKINLGKNDLWDARYDNLAEDYALKHDDLIQYQKKYGFHWFDTNDWCEDLLLKREDIPEEVKVYYGCPTAYRLHEGKGYLDASGPAPKRAANIQIVHPGLSNTKVTSKLDISNGVLTVIYAFKEGNLIIESFIHKAKNLIMLKLTAEGSLPWFRIIVEKLPDNNSADIPSPNVIKGVDMRHWTLGQKIPDGLGVDEFNWFVSSAFPTLEQCKHNGVALDLAYSLRQDIIMEDGDSIVLSTCRVKPTIPPFAAQ